MGCQNSKLMNADILAIPPKLRPLLWRKVEEIRRRRSSAVTTATTESGESTTISKKDLLKEGEVLTRRSDDDNNSEKTSLRGHDESVSSSSQAKADQEIEKTNYNDIDEEEKEITKEVVKEALKENRDEENEKEEEIKDIEEYDDNGVDDDDDDDNQERNICPGSPSFRVYYLESLDKEKKRNHDDHEDLDYNNYENAKDTIENIVDNQKIIMQTKTSRESSVESIVLEDSNVNDEDQENKTTTTTKRLKNRKRITRAIRRGPNAMKQFLTVKSCYHPTNESASLLPKKTAVD